MLPRERLRKCLEVVSFVLVHADLFLLCSLVNRSLVAVRVHRLFVCPVDAASGGSGCASAAGDRHGGSTPHGGRTAPGSRLLTRQPLSRPPTERFECTSMCTSTVKKMLRIGLFRTRTHTRTRRSLPNLLTRQPLSRRRSRRPTLPLSGRRERRPSIGGQAENG